LFVDHAGDTIPLTNQQTGEIVPAYLFVAVLGASNYTYAEATLYRDLPNWIGSHVRAFEFLGACPEIVVPDNWKTGVTRACRYEPELNQTYSEMAQHYGVAIIPARPAKPRDKAYVSDCTSFRLCDGESRLLAPATSVAFENRALFQRLV